jgi:hypothetical protein
VGLIFCLRMPESARWLLARDRIAEATELVKRFIAPTPLPALPANTPGTAQPPAENLSTLQVLKEMASPKMRRDAVLAVVPWFMCDAVHFAIVMFAPFILEKMLQADGLPFLDGCIRAAQANLLLSVSLLIGFGLNCWMIDRVGRMKLQVFGFLGMAASLGVLGWFASMAQQGNSVLRLIHYPPVPDDAPAGAVRAAAHEDINLVTLLVESTSGGLEIKTRDGRWIPVHALHGQIVLDAGDMLQRCTNGRIPSTTHRVVNPRGPNVERYSMPFFTHPRPECLLAPVEGTVTADRPALAPPITAHDFLTERLRAITA